VGNFSEYIKNLTVESMKNDFNIENIETDKNHIDILVDPDPTKSPLDFVRKTKMLTTYYSWRSIWVSYLKSFYWKEKTLWSDEYFVATTGQASSETIKKYIESQG
jgi:putative transposase